MAPRNGRSEKQLKKHVEQKTDNVVLISAIVGLVLCCAINGSVAIAAILAKAPEQSKPPVPEFVFWILGAAIVPDFIKFIRGTR